MSSNEKAIFRDFFKKKLLLCNTQLFFTRRLIRKMKKNLTPLSIAEMVYAISTRWVFTVSRCRTVFVSQPIPFWVRR
jgi:hypothetical protein